MPAASKENLVNKAALTLIMMLVATSLIITSPPGFAQQAENITTPPFTKIRLLSQYQSIKPALNENQFGSPFYLQSDVQKTQASGNVYAVLPHDYTTLANQLSKAGNWCEAISPHINVKGCVIGNSGNNIRLYVGSKEYQHPEDAYEFLYEFSLAEQNGDYTHVQLTSSDGPFDTGDHTLNVEFAPIDDQLSFIHFSYSARYGGIARFALNAYLATFARNKIGFTHSGYDPAGNPIYIQGFDGMIERNAMRYYFALHSYFDTLSQPEDTRFDARMNRWFDFVEKYPKQLYELDRGEYMQAKQKQHTDQLEMKLVTRNNYSSHDFFDYDE